MTGKVSFKSSNEGGEDGSNYSSINQFQVMGWFWWGNRMGSTFQNKRFVGMVSENLLLGQSLQTLFPLLVHRDAALQS